MRLDSGFASVGRIPEWRHDGNRALNMRAADALICAAAGSVSSVVNWRGAQLRRITASNAGREDRPMMRLLIVAAFVVAAAPALADSYPVSGRFGVVTAFTDKPLDCQGKRIVAFNGNQRTDSNGGVPAYRNRSVTADGAARWKVIDIFTTGQISNAQAIYTLHAVDDRHLEMVMQQGGRLKLQRCK
jgi:hypothetical protein